MGTSIKLNGTDSSNKLIYWDPTSVAVKSYSTSGTDSTPSLSGHRTLQDDFVWLDCCYSEDGVTPSGSPGKTAWRMPSGTAERRDYTFAWGFNSAPIVIATHLNTTTLATLGQFICQVEATTTDGVCIKLVNNNTGEANTHYDVMWIAVGK